MYAVMEEIERVRERNRRDYEALAQMTGKTIAEIEADTTAPDPMAPNYETLAAEEPMLASEDSRNSAGLEE